MHLTLTKSLIALMLAGMIQQAQATILVANAPSASVAVVAANFGGTFLDSATSLISNISYNGTARTAVYSTATGLDFYYQFTNNASSQNGIDRIIGFDFSSLGVSAVDVYQTAAGFGIFVDGTEFSDYADRTTPGVIGFNFVPNGNSKVMPGTSSYIQIIRTTATQYQSGNFGIIDGIAANADGFASAVPESSSSLMLLGGVLLIGAIAIRKSKSDAPFSLFA